MSVSSLADVIEAINKSASKKFGLICLNGVFALNPRDNLVMFLESLGVPLPESPFVEKTELMKRTLVFLQEQFDADKTLRKQYPDLLNYIGEMLCVPAAICDEMINLGDFIAKSDLIDVFADFCADIGITVYQCYDIPDYGLNLFLTKKDPLLKTESVFVRTAMEMRQEYNHELLERVQASHEVADWAVFVTTPLGVKEVGLQRLVDDMDRVNAWLYVVDPYKRVIRGVTKGKKSKIKDQTRVDAYVNQLPARPIRAPSQVKKFSKYAFSERDSYKAKKFQLYYLSPENAISLPADYVNYVPKYRDIFRSLLVIEKASGVSMFSYSNELIDDQILSGFLSAIDSFMHELGQGSALQEISYQGLMISAAHGQYVEVVLFLSESIDQGLKERLIYFVKLLEDRYGNLVKEFQVSTNSTPFFARKEELVAMANKILDLGTPGKL